VRKARDDQDRPQIIVDADYTGRFTTDIVVRNIGQGIAKNITFEFSAPLECPTGPDITELPYFKHGINFMAPQTECIPHSVLPKPDQCPARGPRRGSPVKPGVSSAFADVPWRRDDRAGVRTPAPAS
jgi:hypothetical protein